MIDGFKMDYTSARRAHYLYLDKDGRHDFVEYDVEGWAAMDGEIWPVRLHQRWGRGILAGSDLDPDKENFLGVLLAGESLTAFGEEVDYEILERLHAAQG